MSGRAQARLLPDGRRLHLQDGPIDLVIEVFGPDEVVAQAYRGASAAFDGLLDGLCCELSALRAPSSSDSPMPTRRSSVFRPLPGEGGSGEARGGWGSTARSAVPEELGIEIEGRTAAPKPHPSPLRVDTFPSQGKEFGAFSGSAGPGQRGMIRGPVARRMARAVAPFAAETFITPMAAVAGAVADHILTALRCDPRIARAYVNNGGDIALDVAPGERLTIGLIDRPDRPSLLGHVVITHGDGIGGIATSGWRGRSFSLGIADAVTVLARSAAEADAAATIIANAVDLPGHPAVVRAPADSLQPDSDLGSRLVTRDVGPLTEAEIAIALAVGVACAETLLARGLILGAALQLQGRVRVTHTQCEEGAVLLPLSGEGGSAEGRDGWGLAARSATPSPPVALRVPPSPGRGGRATFGRLRHDVLEPAHA